MQGFLSRHPQSTCDPVARIEVCAERRPPCDLRIRYSVTGRISDLRIPAAAPSARAGGLWSRTCFEAFVRAGPGIAYFEFNFSPSTEWAGYAFDGYRRGMREALELPAPFIEVKTSPERCELEVRQTMGERFLHQSWNLGLSAVIEELDGRKSYWALAHPSGRPDFHHPDCFALELPRL